MKPLLDRVLFIGLLCLPFTLRCQSIEKWDSFSVVHHLDLTNLNSKRLFRDKKKASSLENSIANFYLFRNGILVKPGVNSNRDFFAAGCLCFRFNDTLLFSSGLGHSEGVGIGLKIYQNQFSSSLHVNSGNAQVFKLNLSDSVDVADLTAEPLHQTLKLTKSPQGSDDVLIGEFTGTYRNFYQKGLKSGREYNRKYRVRLIFKCKIQA